MYLTKDRYIGAYYEHNNVQGEIAITADGVEIDIDFSQVESITQRVMQWRKSNQIHKWFVENVQNGVDECQRSQVTTEQLTELNKSCKEVLEFKDRASEIMPSQGGFFFGGESYDEWYFQDIEATIEALDIILSKEYDYNTTFFYQASW